MNRIRVLEVCYSLKAAGIETFCNNIQAVIDRERFEVHYLLYKDSEKDMFYKKQIEENGGLVKSVASHCNLFLIRHFINRKRYFFYLKLNEYDVVHVHASSGLNGIEVILAAWAGVNSIIVHSHSSELGKSGRFFGLKKIIHKSGLKWINKYARVKLACSKEAGRWLFGESSFVIIPNGINCNRFVFSEELRKKTRDNLCITDDEFVVGHIGTFSQIKNHNFLIDIFNYVCSVREKSKLLLVGDGSLLPNVMNKVRDLKIEERVLFLGTRDDSNELLMAMDCFVFPSFWEGLPIALIEAQATGLNCVVSDKITSDVSETDLVSFVSLDRSPEEWGDLILHLKNEKNRSEYSNQIASSRFDLNCMIQEIEREYSMMISPGRNQSPRMC